MTTGVTCTVYVDGARAADGSTGDDLTGPVILDDLSVNWGRESTMSQPEADTCTFEVMDQAGGQEFTSTYRTGRRVDVVARGLTYPDASVQTFLNPGFETSSVTWSTTAASATRVTTRLVSGGYALQVKPTSSSSPGTVILAPGELQPAGTNPDAWDEIPTSSPGQTWTASLRVWLPTGASSTLRAVLFTGPYATAGTPAGTPRTIVGDGTWQTVAVELPLQASALWVGLQLVLDPTGPSWDQMPPALTWNGVDPSWSWDDLGSMYLDDVAVLAPGTGAGRSVLVFSGRISDLEAGWDTSTSSPVVKVTCVGFTADLQNRIVGDEPWSVEDVELRAHRILDLAGLPISIDIDSTLDSTLLSYRDVDAQGATGLLQEIATSVDGVLWPAVHQAVGAYLRLEDPSLRASLLQLDRVDGPAAEILHTNLVTNPDAETAGAVATVRLNLATNPATTAWVSATGTALGWNNSRWFGSSGAGTHTLVTGAVDGPAGLTTYGRKTWTTAPTAGGQGDTGFQSNNWTGLVPGAVYTVSSWMRASVNRSAVGFDVEWKDAVGTFQRLALSSDTLTAGVWKRFSGSFTAPSTGATNVGFILDTDSGTNWAVGNTLDVTGLVVEQVGTVGAVQRTNYATNPFDRNVTGWSATGAATLTQVAGSAQFGVGYARLTSTGAAAAYGMVASSTIPVVAGEAYVYSAYFRGVVGRTLQLRLTWSDATSRVSNTATIASATTWQRGSMSGTIPAGVTTARLDVIVLATGTIAGDIVDVDGLLYERGTQTLGAYFDGTTVGSTVEYAWTAAPHASSSVARALPSGVAGPYFDGSTAASGDFTYAWSGTAHASTSVQRAPGLVGVGRYGVPIAWTATTEHDHGSRSWAVLPTSTVTPQGLIWTVADVPTGRTISALLRVKGPAGLALMVTARTSTGSSVAPVLFTCTGAWETITFATTAVAGTTLIGVQLTTRTPYTAVPFYADLVLVVVEAEAYAGAYFDGNTPDTTTRDYAWSGAAHASTSTESTVQTHTIVVVQGDPDIGFDLSACVILRDPVRWVQDVSDVVTRVSATWKVQGVDDDGLPTTSDSTELVVDAELEAQYGTRGVSVSTQLQAAADASEVAQKVLARSSPLGWRADGLTIDDDDVDGSPDGIALVLDLLDGTSRIGAPVVLGDLPSWTPTGAAVGVYLEGGTYRFVGGRWVLDLLVSSAGGLGQSAAWDELDPVWQWDQWDPSITWNDLRGVAAP